MLALVLVTWPDLQTMLSSLMNNLPPLWALVEAVSYIAGMMFGLKAVYMLKEYGELRTMMSSQTSLMKPMIMFVVSIALCYLPGMYHIALETFYSSQYASPLGYSDSSLGSWQGVITVATNIIQLVGLIAFVRGWVMISHLAQHSGQPVFGKAMTHIIGGILAINIVGTAHVLENTLHIGWS